MRSPDPARHAPAQQEGLQATLTAGPVIAQAQSVDHCPKVPDQTTKAPLSLACSGKSECSAADALTVISTSVAAPTIASMCLDFGDGWLEWLQAATSPLPPQAPMSYPLAPLIARALADGRPANVRARLVRSPAGRLPMDVIILDTTGSTFREHLMFDTTSLWASGQLSLEVQTVDCSPCRLDGILRMEIPSLANWRRATIGDLYKLQLVLNGARIPGLEVTPNLTDGHGTVSFKLHRSSNQPANVTAWDTVLGDALSWRPSPITVALADDRNELARASGPVMFEVMPIGKRVAWAGGALTLLLLIGWWADAKSGWTFLKDDFGIPPGVFPKGQRGPAFSLGKTQMVLWTVIIIVGAVLVAVALDEFPAFNDTAVILLGIGTGTAVGAAAVVPKVVTNAIANYNASPAANGPALLQLTQSQGFWQDITRDYGSTSPDLHRLQNIAFTIVLMVMFMSTALLHGVFPEFSSSWLTLMGVSGGAYVGFKAVGN